MTCLDTLLPEVPAGTCLAAQDSASSPAPHMLMRGSQPLITTLLVRQLLAAEYQHLLQLLRSHGLPCASALGTRQYASLTVAIQPTWPNAQPMPEPCTHWDSKRPVRMVHVVQACWPNASSYGAMASNVSWKAAATASTGGSSRALTMWEASEAYQWCQSTGSAGSSNSTQQDALLP